MNAEIRVLQLPDGPVHYRDVGRGAPIVLLHGALTNGEVWRKVIGPLSQHYRCLVPDLPLGAHRAPMLEGADLSPPGIARLIDAFITRLDLRDVTLVGNDTGGAYAQIYAATHPQRLARLVLSNCDALEVFPPRHFASLQRMLRVPGYLGLMGALFRIRPFLKSSMVLGLLSHRLTGTEIFDLYMRHFVGNAAVRRDFRKLALGWGCVHTLKAAERFGSFHQPVLLLWGLDDEALFPRTLAERLAARFPNAEIAPIANALTYVQEDQPEAFVTQLQAFMRKTQ